MFEEFIKKWILGEPQKSATKQVKQEVRQAARRGGCFAVSVAQLADGSGGARRLNMKQIEGRSQNVGADGGVYVGNLITAYEEMEDIIGRPKTVYVNTGGKHSATGKILAESTSLPKVNLQQWQGLLPRPRVDVYVRPDGSEGHAVAVVEEADEAESDRFAGRGWYHAAAIRFEKRKSR